MKRRNNRVLEFLGFFPFPDPVEDVGPPPDGGQGWVQVLVAHLVLFNTWGYFNSYGLFIDYYASAFPGTTLSALSWAGSTQIFLLLLISTLSGRVFDAGYYRLTLLVGSILQVVAIFMTSLASQYWQLFMAQGICGGIGAGIIYVPTVSCVATYFAKRRALAVSFATSGTATGGVVFPIIAQQLLPRIGFGWTVRVMGFVVLFNCLVVFALGRPRIPRRSSGKFVELEAWKEAPYSLFTVGVFLCLWAVYIGYDYINIYASSVLGAPDSTALVILLILNAMGLPGRLVPALVSDAYLGPFQTLTPIVISSGIMYFCWIAVKSIKGLYVFSIFFGLVNGGVQGMILAGLPSLTTDLSKMGTRSGMVLTVVSFATLTGPPLAGALIHEDAGGFLYLQIWGGLSMLIGAGFLLAARRAASSRSKTEP
ncbi:MFS monocarboxylate transporter [Pseudovirgaria hyperparasitica]|uniref:MFS monocarboxylate transporter n=1 Tax=Pseudovirgaria hyperparasitica TaxID=470096 RepID=A0A6A6WK03_9PEZI|nr:MFS monocarboxylate transporter [Pseudovirgaria hyperparasitica]KAF2762457.1 MFS monocarboxylate transporter [Pseudovirgaria hyperparasitica]